MLGKEYFFYAYGPIYALSADVVSSLVVLRNVSYAGLLQFEIGIDDDVHIGAFGCSVFLLFLSPVVGLRPLRDKTGSDVKD